MHVPLIVAGPGIPHGQTDALAYLFDLFPTICDCAGISHGTQVDGLSLAPILTGRAPKVREWLYTAYRDCQRAITDGRWKLIRYPLINKTQLFDLSNDPHELNDLAAAPEHAERVRLMMDRLADLQHRANDPTPLTAPVLKPAEWSPAKLTPEELKYQSEETARNVSDSG